MLEHGIGRAGLDVSAVLATMLQDPGSERVQGHLVRTIISGLNRFLVAANPVGHGLSISQPATRLSTSNLASVPLYLATGPIQESMGGCSLTPEAFAR